MKIHVRLFARAKDLAGTESVMLDMADGSTAGDLRKLLVGMFPKLAPLLERCALAVNEEVADDTLTLPRDAEVALLPPVSGGLT